MDENVVNVLTLDTAGLFSAAMLGIALFILGGSNGWLFLSAMIVFLILSAMVTEYRKEEKRKLGVKESARSWKNVVANGTVPFIVAVLYFANGYAHFAVPAILIASYIATLSAIVADKFASEIGVLDGKPVMLLTLRVVDKGVSGGITSLGITGGLLASMIMATLSLTLQGSLLFFIVVVVAGFFGNVVDSVFGYFEDRGIGNKFTTNMLCAAAAFLLSYFLLTL